MSETRSFPVISAQASFYRGLPVRSQIKFLAAVFFTIAPIWLLSWSSLNPSRPWPALLALMLCSGLIAVGAALCFLRSMKFLVLEIPVIVLSWMFVATLTEPVLSMEGMAVAMLVLLGYAFFLGFINDEGSRSFTLQTQMAVAREVHHTLVPPISRRGDRLEVFGDSYPSSAMGGDLFDVYEREGRTWIYVADVSGHGVQAGVIMAMIRSALRVQLLGSAPLEEMIGRVNDLVLQLNRPELFVTLACMQFETSGSASFVRAGHLPILHFRHGDRTLHKLSDGYLPLGVSAGMKFLSRRVELSAGDLLVFLTDGLTEVTDRGGNEFGHERIEALILEHGNKPLADLHAIIMTAVQRFGPQADDQTLLLTRRA